MRRTVSIFLLLWLAGSFGASGQKMKPYASRWQLRPVAGYYFSTSPLLKGEVSDYFLEYSDRSFYVQALSLARFFKRWGVEFNYQACFSKRTRERGDNFSRAMHNQYDSAYFVTPSSGADYKGAELPESAERGYLGIVYRIETNRWVLYPKVSIGVTSFFTDWGRVYLKERNSNKVLQVGYNKTRDPHDQLTVAASAAMGYKLSKHLFVNIDLLSSFYRVNTSVTTTVTDLDTKKGSLQVTDYKKGIVTIAVGAGVIVALY